jgi:hypothetical protein
MLHTNKIKTGVIALAVLTTVFTSCKKTYSDDYQQPDVPPVASAVFSAAGDSASLVTKLNDYRNLIGATLNVAPGATGGRREVNWDAVPASFTNSNNFPFDFFGSADPALANGRKRGLIMTNTGTSFRVDSTDYADIDPSYAAQFEVFSKKRLFVYLGNTVTDITFKVPGSLTDASVKGFGVIFSDVDDANSTSMEFFDGSKSLGVFKAPAAAGSGKFSFLGVQFPNDKVTRVKIICGNGLLATGVKDLTDGGTKDLVVMDDFLYSEPISQ